MHYYLGIHCKLYFRNLVEVELYMLCKYWEERPWTLHEHEPLWWESTHLRST